MRYRKLFLLLALIVGLMLVTSSGMPARLVAAQDLPTKPPIQQPTKPPVVPTQAPPTKAPLPPTSVPPTKAPLPPTAVPPTKTPWPTVILPTKTPWPTPLPTVEATAQISAPTEAAQSVASPSMPPTITAPVPARPQANTRTNTEPTLLSQPGADITAVPLIGVVFDDRNGNGMQDSDEPGLQGVAIVVETGGQQQILLTDNSGVYRVTPNPAAQVKVIPPAGWQAAQSAALPLDQTRNFALQQVAADRGRTLPTITQTVLDLAPLVTLGGILAAVLAFGLLRIGRSVSTGNRQLALIMVRMQRTSEQPVVFDAEETDNKAHDTKLLGLLNQAALDATGRSLRIESILKVMGGSASAIIALGHDAGRAVWVVFTPVAAKAFRHGLQEPTTPPELLFSEATAYPLDRLLEGLGESRSYPVDALSSGLFVTDDLAAGFHWLAAELPVSVRTLPRTDRWHLLVAPVPRSVIKMRFGLLQRLRQAYRLQRL